MKRDLAAVLCTMTVLTQIAIAVSIGAGWQKPCYGLGLQEQMEPSEARRAMIKLNAKNDQQKIAADLLQLGRDQYVRDNFKKSKETIKLALPLCKKAYGPESAPYILCLELLSRSLRHEGELKRSEDLAQEHLSLVKHVEGPMSNDYAYGLRNLGILRLEQHRDLEAEKLLKSSVRVLIGNLGPQHVSIESSLMFLCTSLERQGKTAESSKIRAKIEKIELARLSKNNGQVKLIGEEILKALSGVDEAGTTQHVNAAPGL